MRCPILYSITLRQRSSWDLHAPPVPARVAALRPLAGAPRPGGAGAPRQTRPGAVSGLLRPCLLVRGGAKTAARCGFSR